MMRHVLFIRPYLSDRKWIGLVIILSRKVWACELSCRCCSYIWLTPSWQKNHNKKKSSVTISMNHATIVPTQRFHFFKKRMRKKNPPTENSPPLRFIFVQQVRCCHSVFFSSLGIGMGCSDTNVPMTPFIFSTNRVVFCDVDNQSFTRQEEIYY